MYSKLEDRQHYVFKVRGNIEGRPINADRKVYNRIYKNEMRTFSVILVTLLVAQAFAGNAELKRCVDMTKANGKIIGDMFRTKEWSVLRKIPTLIV